MPKFEIRSAKETEAGLVLDFIKKLAKYEKMLDEVEATEATIYDSLFVKHDAEVVFGCENGIPVGFALFFHNFYKSLGAKSMDDWTIYRLDEARLKEI